MTVAIVSASRALQHAPRNLETLCVSTLLSFPPDSNGRHSVFRNAATQQFMLKGLKLRASDATQHTRIR